MKEGASSFFFFPGKSNGFSSYLLSTPVHLAARWGHVELVKLLLQNGAQGIQTKLIQNNVMR